MSEDMKPTTRGFPIHIIRDLHYNGRWWWAQWLGASSWGWPVTPLPGEHPQVMQQAGGKGGITQSALQHGSHWCCPVGPHRSCLHPTQTPATKRDCQDGYSSFLRVPSKYWKRKLWKTDTCQEHDLKRMQGRPRTTFPALQRVAECDKETRRDRS